MSGIYDLTGKNIENTYQRVLQTPDGTTFYDGTGSLVTLPNANTASLLTTASSAGNTITFTKGDGSTFPVTVAGGTGAPGGPNTSIQFNDNGVFSGSSAFTFDNTSNALTLTGSLQVSTGSNAQPAMQVNSDGIFIIGGFTSTPTPIEGAIMISGSDLYFAV